MSDSNNLLLNLNEEQKQAITAGIGPVLVVAGAGTGKTTVLTKRIAYLVQEWGFDPNRILAITFTNKAAYEMQDRIKKFIDQPFNWIGTFHGVCLKILRHDIQALNRNPNFKIMDEDEAVVLLRDLYVDEKLENKNFSYRNAVHLIDKIKTKNLEEADIANKIDYFTYGFKSLDDAKKFWKIYQKFVTRCINLNLLDFNDILNLAYELLANHENVRQYWSQQFDYILVDEFQDTNEIQYSLLKLLLNPEENLFVVGDPDQTIYTWRGAKQSIINDFHYVFPNAQTIILNRNYRSKQSILNAANKLISKNSNRIKKDLISFDSNDVGTKPLYFIAPSVDVEANWVVRQIDLLKQKGAQDKDVAILYRSNHLSRPFEQALVEYGFKYNIYGGFKFYQRSEIKDLLAYLSSICNHDEISLRRIINIPARRISDLVVQGILNYSHEQKISFWDACTSCQENPYLSNAQKNAVEKFVELINNLSRYVNEPLDKIVVEILSEVGYEAYLKNLDQTKLKDKMSNIEELLNAMTNYMHYHSDWTLRKYLQDIALYISSDDKKNNKDAINLMTVHSAKGLEFKYVFLIGMIDGVFPSNKESSLESKEEERRIAYVALTRAKEQLFLSTNNDYSFRTQTTNKPSEFINEISKEYLDYATNSFKVKSNLDLDYYDSQAKPSTDYYNQDSVNDYRIGDQIIHTTFGLGIIIGIESDNLIIKFNHSIGTKQIVFNHKSIKRILN